MRLSARACFLVVPFQSLIEKLVVYRLDAFVAIVDVQMRAASVYIFSFELAAVVIDRAFADLSTDRSFHKSHFLSPSGRSRGSVTLVKE